MSGTTEANYRLDASENSGRFEEMLCSKGFNISARQSSPEILEVMHVDRLHEQDRLTSHAKRNSSFSKHDDNSLPGSASLDISALPRNKRRKNNEENMPNEVVREKRGFGDRFYADRNDIQNSKSPS